MTAKSIAVIAAPRGRLAALRHLKFRAVETSRRGRQIPQAMSVILVQKVCARRCAGNPASGGDRKSPFAK
jgi:hypothetical protein